MSIDSELYVAKECRFVVHIPVSANNDTDLHLVKEQVHMKDGTIVPQLHFIKDFTRPFYVTKPDKRNHKQKKEWEHIDNLLCKEVTQSNLRNEVAKLLDKAWSKDNLRKLSASPYLYGTDISSTSLVKHAYMERYPNVVTPYSVAAFDIETDVVNGTEEIIMASIIFKDKIFLSVVKSFVSGFSLLEEQFMSKVNQYIGKDVAERNMSVELHVGDNVIEVIKAVFEKAHLWKPDFLAIWNMDFDIPIVLKMLEKYKIDPKTILCDPSIPPSMRICKYKQGAKKKVTSSNKVKPISPANQWHTLELTSSFYVIDGMCVYRQIRQAKQEESSYSLDAILTKELGIQKLKFKEADGYQELKWHQFMQTEYKLEYMVYNIFDSLAMLKLDDKIKDLCFTLPISAATTDFHNVKSIPKRIVDAFYYFCKADNYILGTATYTGHYKKFTMEAVEDNEYVGLNNEGSDVDESEDDTLGLVGWILTLPAHLSMLGLNLIKEDPNMRTGIRTHTYDSDMVGAYPTCISVANVSKSTTSKELIGIETKTDDLFKMQNLNLIIGPANAIDYSVSMFNLPKPDELLYIFNSQL